MTRSTPADILSYLNTNWVIGTIAKPAFIDQFENQIIKVERSLGVNWGGITWIPQTTGFTSKDEETNTLLIQIVEDTIAHLNTTVDLTRSLLKGKTLAGGHYMITMGNPIKVGNFYQCFLTLEEVTSLQ